MEKKLADALLDFYQKILKPEFDVIQQKQAEHDERLLQVFGHLDSIYTRLGRLEDQISETQGRLDSIEQQLPEVKR